ncbi:uncharacterized protein LOC120553210 isoform X2 [Perca fluviatilis]|uniref:uncharacterized protein LOC120553210 isoform X2 n=1 Tax=Perca fluviatilis TaxID=8168 RepID=UPI001964D51A|nr:uncharacterized protein LOC120553210 isoform X2 [Perca fluviatilis]
MVFERICQKELNKLPKNPGSCLAAVEKAVAETDVAAVLPLGRQHSLLNIINVLIQKLGHLIHIYLPKVLQILLCVTASVSTLLDNRFLMQRYIIWTNPSALQECHYGKFECARKSSLQAQVPARLRLFPYRFFPPLSLLKPHPAPLNVTSHHHVVIPDRTLFA